MLYDSPMNKVAMHAVVGATALSTLILVEYARSQGDNNKFSAQAVITRLGEPVDVEKVSMGAKESERKAAELDVELQRARQEVGDLMKQLSEQNENLKKLQDKEVGKTAAVEWLGGEMAKYGGTVYVNGDFVVVDVPQGEFREGKDTPEKSLKPVLKTLSQAAVRFSSEFDLIVEGHADASKVKKGGKFRDNWDVAYSRAYNVAKEISRLISKEEGIAITSRGSSLPAGGGMDGKNPRRVQFLFASKRASGSPNAPEPTPEPAKQPETTDLDSEE